MTNLAKLKTAINLADIIERQHPLSKGNRYRKGLEHDSLVVDTTKNEYWWNSKSEWGDVIDWVGRYVLGYNGQWDARDPAKFKDAVRELARLAGQPEPQFKPEDPQERANRLSRQQLLEKIAGYYHVNYLASPEAQQYAARRGWSEKTTKKFRLGFSDGKIIDLLNQDEKNLAKDMGLVAERDGRWFDAIPAGCLVYPHWVRGKIVYLSGRAIDEKRHYNLYAPKELYWAMPGGYGGDLVIVEGQADALTLAQWGISAVALCGVNIAALDPESLDLFDVLYIALDNDPGGRQNLDRLAEHISPLIRVVTWPDELGKDINDMLVKGVTGDQFRAHLATSKPYLDYVIEQTPDVNHPDYDSAVESLFKLLARLDSFRLTRYRSKVCDVLSMNRADFDRLLSLARNADDDFDEFLRGEQYTVRDGWTIYKQHTPTGRVTSTPLANAILKISGLIERDNGSGEVFREYVITGKHSSGRQLHPCSVPTDEFMTMNWVAREYPNVIIGAGRKTQDQLREAIQHLSGEIPRRVIYEHTGWRQINGQWCYLTTSGALGLGESTARIEVDLNLGRPDTYMNLYRLPLAPENIQHAILASLSFWELTDYTITVPQWGAVYLAPLSPFLPVDFGLWVHGKTGSFKSVIAALALAHYGDWTGREGRSRLPANFISTANNILMNAFIVKDAVMVIDDYAPGNTAREMRERDEVASRLLRSVGNRAARGRMKDGRRFQADYPPRCLAFITAEDLPPGQSILARGIGVRVFTPKKGTPERQTIEQRITHAQNEASLLYSHALSAYLLWIRRHWDELQKQLPVLTQENQKRFAKTSGHARLADAFGKLMSAIDTGLFFMQDAGGITDSQAQERRSIAFDALQKVMVEHAGQIESLDPTYIFVETLREELDAQTWYLAPYEGGETEHPYDAVRAGWQDDRYIYLLPKVVNQLIESYGRRGTPFPVGRNTLYHRLEESGWLVKIGTEYIPAMNTSPHILKIRREVVYPEEQ